MIYRYVYFSQLYIYLMLMFKEKYFLEQYNDQEGKLTTTTEQYLQANYCWMILDTILISWLERDTVRLIQSIFPKSTS